MDTEKPDEDAGGEELSAHEKNKRLIAGQIEEADIPLADQKNLLARLSVASHEGVAAVVRDFEKAIVDRRVQVCQSHRRYYQGLRPDPRNRKMSIMHTKSVGLLQ